MAITKQDIHDMIRESFPEAEVTVEGDDGAHFAAVVVDESFRGLNRVQQQRAVYAALKGKMDGPAGELHALALTTRAPD
ncbi:MAG: BolA/IbaG family iron-sulfur metabolism protein [Pseudomonadota bacterium]